MVIVQHRVNTVEQLRQTPAQLGAELDIRYYANELAIHHDPFVPGQSWQPYMEAWNHRLMIANIKSEGVEEKLLHSLAQHNCHDYFLLDMSLPFMVKYLRKGFRKMAIRFSEYEPVQFVQRFEGLVDWVWVDCFTPQPLTPDQHAYLARHFSICIVSPELQGHPQEVTQQFTQVYRHLPVQAVCTKQPALWQMPA